MKEILVILALCTSADSFEIPAEQMIALTGKPSYGLYLHGSIFVRDDLEPIFKKSVYLHECVHYKQEQELGVAWDWREFHRRECEAEELQRSFLGPYGKGIVGQCNFGSQ